MSKREEGFHILDRDVFRGSTAPHFGEANFCTKIETVVEEANARNLESIFSLLTTS